MVDAREDATAPLTPGVAERDPGDLDSQMEHQSARVLVRGLPQATCAEPGRPGCGLEDRCREFRYVHGGEGQEFVELLRVEGDAGSSLQSQP